MPLWKGKDNAANSDIAALIQVGAAASNTTARDLLFENTTANVLGQVGRSNVVVGQFGVDTNEIRAANQAGAGHPPHAGWVLRHEGRGLKAGRVWYETLVASGSIPSTDNSDDTYFPDYAISIATQPSSNTSNVASNLTFGVVATTVPTGATLTYKWQKYVVANTTWVDIPYTAGLYFNVTTATLTANNITANGNVFRAIVSTTGANSVTSGSATIAKN